MSNEKKNTNAHNDTEKFTRMERLRSDQLHADLPFQKVFNNEIVDLIDYTFDENALQALDASFRDGRYNVFDGKHRLSGIRRYEARTDWVVGSFDVFGKVKIFSFGTVY